MFSKKYDSSVKKTRANISENIALKILGIWGVILSVVYTCISLGEYRRFAPRGMDLGQYDQAIWLYSRFYGMYNTVYRRHIFGDHLTLTLPLLSPLYWIWNDVRALLIFQAVVICVSIIPVYKLARLRMLSSWQSLGVAMIYSVFFGIQQSIFSDFHPVVIGVVFLLWTAYFFEAKRTVFFVISLILLLGTQENMGIALSCLGLVYVFDNRFRARAWWFIPFGVFATGISMYIVGRFSPIGYEYTPVISLSPVENIRLLFDNHDKLSSWWYSYISFGFLPLFSLGSVMAVVVDMAQYFNTGPAAYFKDKPFTHHRIVLAPLLLLGLFQTLEWFKKIQIRIDVIIGLLILLNVGIIIGYRFPLYEVFTQRYWIQEQWMRDADIFIKRIPSEMRLSAQPNLVPHISHRKYIYVAELISRTDIPQCNTPCWWLDTGEHAQFLFVRWPSNRSFHDQVPFDAYASAIMNMGVRGKLQEFDREGEMVLFQLR